MELLNGNSYSEGHRLQPLWPSLFRRLTFGILPQTAGKIPQSITVMNNAGTTLAMVLAPSVRADTLDLRTIHRLIPLITILILTSTIVLKSLQKATPVLCGMESCGVCTIRVKTT